MSSHLSKLASLSKARSVVVDEEARSRRKAALHAAWMAHTVKRALAAVASASDADYRAFGWERGDVIARLQWLRDTAKRPRADQRTPTAVTLTRAGLMAGRPVGPA